MIDPELKGKPVKLYQDQWWCEHLWTASDGESLKGVLVVREPGAHEAALRAAEYFASEADDICVRVTGADGSTTLWDAHGHMVKHWEMTQSPRARER
jgi:hypothetical protein